jgi:hypothetical protein
MGRDAYIFPDAIEIEPLSEIRQQYFQKARLSVGVVCPCCQRFGKVYVRKFNKGMATNLINLYRRTRSGFVHLPSTAPRYILNDNQVGKLVFWNMAVAQPNEDDPSKNKSGCWKITDTGIDFVEGRIMVWSHVIEYNQIVEGFREKKRVNISDALGRPFHYQELMSDSPT